MCNVVSNTPAMFVGILFLNRVQLNWIVRCNVSCHIVLQEVTTLGMSPLYDSRAVTFDVVRLVNCVHDLLQKHQNSARIREELENRSGQKKGIAERQFFQYAWIHIKPCLKRSSIDRCHLLSMKQCSCTQPINYCNLPYIFGSGVIIFELYSCNWQL